MGEGPNIEQKNFRDRLSMFTLFSVKLANSTNFINEIADFFVFYVLIRVTRP